MPLKLTHNQFVEKLKKVNKNVKVISEYSGNKKPITVKCLIDNHIWSTTPNRLMKEQGCQMCYNRNRGNKTRKNIDSFINKANQIHNNKYDYSKIEYKNNKTKICIICPEHGEFWQEPNKHLIGQGCPNCANKNITTEDFIKKAKLIHGDKYDYTKVNYINYKTKVCIICPKHGEFWQTPEKHLSGNACPICNESKLEKEVAKYLGNNSIKYERQKKFKWLGKQSLDFYLPEYNIGIECQGIQHFKSFSYFKGIFGFLKIIKRDMIKNKLCKENNIKLLYILNKKDKIDYTLNNLELIYNYHNVFYIEDILCGNILLNKIK